MTSEATWSGDGLVVGWKRKAMETSWNSWYSWENPWENPWLIWVNWMCMYIYIYYIFLFIYVYFFFQLAAPHFFPPEMTWNWSRSLGWEGETAKGCWLFNIAMEDEHDEPFTSMIYNHLYIYIYLFSSGNFPWRTVELPKGFVWKYQSIPNPFGLSSFSPFK